MVRLIFSGDWSHSEFTNFLHFSEWMEWCLLNFYINGENIYMCIFVSNILDPAACRLVAHYMVPWLALSWPLILLTSWVSFLTALWAVQFIWLIFSTSWQILMVNLNQRKKKGVDWSGFMLFCWSSCHSIGTWLDSYDHWPLCVWHRNWTGNKQHVVFVIL